MMTMLAGQSMVFHYILIIVPGIVDETGDGILCCGY